MNILELDAPPLHDPMGSVTQYYKVSAVPSDSTAPWDSSIVARMGILDVSGLLGLDMAPRHELSRIGAGLQPFLLVIYGLQTEIKSQKSQKNGNSRQLSEPEAAECWVFLQRR